ncbi:VOC family protein [Candidatus Gracilibacteria bacterium]|nr:VOC family protein [Candidatus Gracilibacteria bacterium]
MTKQNPVVWFEIYVADMNRAQKFYETVFQTKLEEISTPDDQDMIMMGFPRSMESKAAANGALIKMEGFNGGGGGTIVYFQSEDCAIEEARVEQAGGKIQQAKTSIGEYGNMSLVIDTEGNMIGIHSEK